MTGDEVKAQYGSAPITTTTSTTTTSTSTTTQAATTTTTSLITTTIIATTTSTTTTTTLSSKVIVTRDLPAYDFPGSDLMVALAVDINESNKPNTIGLTEYFPAGWNVSEVSLGGILKTTPDRIEWIFSPITNPVQDYVVNYTLIIPSNANGTYVFSGTTDTDNSSYSTTTGDTTMLVRGTVTLSEIVNIINDWIDGKTSLTEVIAMINAWASTR